MRIGLVGCGRWGQFILRDLVLLGSDVTVVARSSESRARATSGQAESVVNSIVELGDVAGVVVATPTSTHASVITDALKLGVPVFVEKPMTNNAAAARLLARKAAGRLFVMDKWRYHAGVEALGALVRSGEYGRLRSIHSRRLSWGQDHDDVDAVWVLLPHDLSIVQELAGGIPVAIAAVGIIDSAKFGCLTALLGPNPTCTFEISSMSPNRERRILVQFDDAIAILDDAYSSAISVVRFDSGERIAIPISDALPLERELAAFVGYLQGGPPPRSSAADGAQAVERVTELRALAGI